MALESYGDYVGLPTFDQKGLTAVVAGANGISGQHMLRVLARHPDRWTKIYALSRRPSQGLFKAPNVEHVSLDLLSGVENIKKTLKENNITKVDHVFFLAYKETTGSEGSLFDGHERRVEDNGKMLEDLIHAMEDISVKRIVLQTGAKHYGVHVVPVLRPNREDDPRVLTVPNFYYTQEDILERLAPKYGFTYSVVRPSHIVGAVKGNAMNVAIVLGLYFSVLAELKEPVIFPGTEYKWNSLETFSSANMNSYIEEWCALTPGATNQAFNSLDGQVTTWRRLFIDLAKYWNLPIDGEQFEKPAAFPVYHKSDIPAPDGGKNTAVIELRHSLEAWSKQPRVVEAWEAIAKREGLDVELFHDATWSFADGIISIQQPLVMDVSKLRSTGFFGHVDSTKAFTATFDLAAELKLLPRRS